jgi:GNAT superfamily N-acetyltransferase
MADASAIESEPEAAEPVEGRAQLRDGREVVVRRMVEEDRELIEDFLSRLSDSSISVRFFAPVPRSTALLTLFEGVADPDRCALLLVVPGAGREAVVAHAEYARDGPKATAAEVAFLVADSFQGHGCATLLLHRLARAARRVGIREFHASVLMENDQMLEVFRGSGFPTEEWWGPDAVQVTFPVTTGRGGAAGAFT